MRYGQTQPDAGNRPVAARATAPLTAFARICFVSVIAPLLALVASTIAAHAQCTGGPPDYTCAGTTGTAQTLNAASQAATATVSGTFTTTGTAGVTGSGGNSLTFTSTLPNETILGGRLSLTATGSNTVSASVARGSIAGITTSTQPGGSTTLDLGSGLAVSSTSTTGAITVTGVGSITNAATVTGGMRTTLANTSAGSLTINNNNTVNTTSNTINAGFGILVLNGSSNATTASTAVSITNTAAVSATPGPGTAGQGISVRNCTTECGGNALTTSVITNAATGSVTSAGAGIYVSDSAGVATVSNLGSVTSANSAGSFVSTNARNITWTNGGSGASGASASLSGGNAGLRTIITGTGGANGVISITNYGVTAGSTTGGIFSTLAGASNGRGVEAINQAAASSLSTQNVSIDNFGTIRTSSTGKTGVYAQSTNGSVRIGNYSNNSIISLSGAGIDASAAGNVTVSNGNFTGPNPDGKIEAGLVGVSAISTGVGDVSVTNGANASITAGTSASTGSCNNVANTSEGICAKTNGAGLITIQSAGTITTTGNGVNTLGVDGATTINNRGAITATGGNGLFAVTTGSGAINVTNSSAGTITANLSGMRVEARAAGGTVTVDNAASIVATTGDGILARSWSGALQITNSGAITANAGSNIQRGISASPLSGSPGVIDVTVLSTGPSILSRNEGILAQSLGGNVGVTNSAAITNNAGSGSSGITATTNGSGNASVINTGAITADGTTTGNNNDLLNRGAIQAATVSGVATINNGGEIISRAGDGLSAITTTGEINIINNRTITATAKGSGLQRGIRARASDAGKITVSSTGLSITSFNEGILATSVGGAVEVTNSAAIGNNSGSGSSGIKATTTGTGTVGVINSGAITASLNGVETSAVNGETTVNNSGNVITTSSGAGVKSSSTGGSIFVTNGAATVSGKNTKINAQNIGVSPTALTNLGDIRSNTGAPGDLADYAIASATPAFGAIAIDNAATIRGRIALTDGADAFTNRSGASWETTGLSSFGNGANTFTNAAGAVTRSWGATTIDMGSSAGNVISNGGLIQIRNAADGTTGVTSFTAAAPSNLNFNNSGLIDLANDGANLVSNRVNIQGNFISSGASLIAVNTQVGGVGSVSDRVFIDGNSTGTGTGIVVRDTIGGLGAANTVGIAVVGVKGSNSAPDFVLNGASDHFKYRNGQPVLDKGLYFYYMDRSPTSTGCDNGYTCFSLFSAPSTAARSLPIAVTAAQTIWQEDALMWEDRQVELRDEVMMRKDKTVLGPAPASTVDGGVSTWVKSIGSWTNRSNSVTSWGGGGRALSYDLGYRQNVFSMLGGANVTKAGVFHQDDYLIAGVMGGYLQSNVNFNQEAGNLLGATQFSYSGGTVGGSLTYMSHGFFADGLLKADMLSSNLYIPVAGLTNSRAGVWTAGGVGNLGYRYDWRPFFIEPIATFTYSKTAMGSLLSPTNNLSMTFGGGNDFRGGFGGRVGFVTPGLLAGHIFEASLTGRYWNVFNANGGRTIDISSGGVSDRLGDYTFGRDYGEVKGNLDLYSLGSGWSAFVNTGVRWNQMWTTVTTKGGAAYRW